MTKIRLARFGSRHQPHYRIVVADSRSRRDGKFIEILGFYNPQNGSVKVNNERAEYWISVGAQPTNTTISLLSKGGVSHSFEVQKKPFKAVESQPEAASEASKEADNAEAEVSADDQTEEAQAAE